MPPNDPTAALLSAIRTRLLTAPLIPAERAWENVTYTPSADVPYIEDSWMGGPVIEAELGTGLRRGRYLYQVVVYTPAGEGPHPAMRIADSIAGAFRASPLPVTGATNPAYTVSVRIGPRITNPPGWYALPVSVTFSLDF